MPARSLVRLAFPASLMLLLGCDTGLLVDAPREQAGAEAPAPPGATAGSVSATTGASGSVRQYLVAGQKDALPDPGAIAAAGGTWVGQIGSIGVAVVRSSNPDFLTLVRRDQSVALVSP